MRFPWLFVFAAILLPVAGCQSSNSKPPLLGSKDMLGPNVGERVTIDGTARYNSVWGPSIVGDDFELPVFTDKPWGSETSGKKIEVIGKLNSKHKFDQPPLRDVGDYWLSDATWTVRTVEKK
jgi:hypothetical protein